MMSRDLITIKELESEPGAIGTQLDYKDHTDPKYIGPGTWNVIHRYAFKSRTHERQLAFIEFMKDVCQGFPCTICKTHCTEYIKNHPMEEYLDILVDINGEKIAIGLFVWSWKFHNAVNVRIKKPVMSWNTAYNIYSEVEPLVCSKNCLEVEGIPPDGIEQNTQNNTFISSVPKINEFVVTQKISRPFRLISTNRK